MSKYRCVVCNNPNNTVSAIGPGTTPDTRPEPGDITICIRCGKAYEFDANLDVQPLAELDIPREYVNLVAEVRYHLFKT